VCLDFVVEFIVVLLTAQETTQFGGEGAQPGLSS